MWLDFTIGFGIGVSLTMAIGLAVCVWSDNADDRRRLKRLEDELQRRTLQRFEDEDDYRIRRDLGGAEIEDEKRQYKGAFPRLYCGDGFRGDGWSGGGGGAA